MLCPITLASTASYPENRKMYVLHWEKTYEKQITDKLLILKMTHTSLGYGIFLTDTHEDMLNSVSFPIDVSPCLTAILMAVI
jgi:hypothetical protein